jgi:hypothetical protein
MPPPGKMVGISKFPQSLEGPLDPPLLSATHADPNSPLRSSALSAPQADSNSSTHPCPPSNMECFRCSPGRL